MAPGKGISALLLCGIGFSQVAHGAVWSTNVSSLCGFAAGLNRTVFVVDGSETLQAPTFCASFACRSALSSAGLTNEETNALNADLLRCASPSAAVTYTMLKFTLGVSSLSSFDSIVAGLDTLPGGPQQVLASTFFPVTVASGVGTSIRYFISLQGTALIDSGQLANKSAVEAALSASTGQTVTLHDEDHSKLTHTLSTGDWAILELWEVKVTGYVLGAVTAVYIVLALLALAGVGPVWLKDLVLCWPALCDGQGCIGYRIFCCPFVLCYNALSIFCCTCCCTYLSWACFPACCKGLCWRSFEDPDFPPNQRSLGNLKGDTASGIMASAGADWARASEIAFQGPETGAQLFEGDIEAADLLQGALGDCWLIAALACIAERPEILQQAIVSKTVDPRGKYTFRLWDQVKSTKGTQWKTIVVDEFIPVQPGTLRPKFSKPHGNEMWAMLMEKAFAKMYGGYDRLEGGQMSWGLSAITGNPSVNFSRSLPGGKTGHEWTAVIDSYYTDDKLDDDAFFKLLHKTYRNGAFICCAGIAQADKKGLINGHAYSIIQLRTVHQSSVSGSFFRLVQIRNPHGGGEWQGSWSDKSDSWTRYPYVAKQINSEGGAEDGSFWMQWEDFVTFWKEVQVVDCATNIRTVATPVYDEHSTLGPLWACLMGCCQYWCYCLGCFRLYCARSNARDVKGLQIDVDKQCGVDQTGFFCTCCDNKASSYDAVEAE